MSVLVKNEPKSSGKAAADLLADAIARSVDERGECRIVLSTGASQFELFNELVENAAIPWEKVTMFHLDEYVGLPESHIASFRKYLKERFVARVPRLREAVFVNGEAPDIAAELARLTARLREAPIDVGVIGIGENGHIAFNDPPADFDTREAYIVVNLSDTCKTQQVREGWFPDHASVPPQAITMTPWQIMRCRKIISLVPHAVKAQAVHDTLAAPSPTPAVPASLLKTHDDWTLILDTASASLCGPELLK
ncbi:MAG: 6-phosphogluconolactonase [Christensenellales bacterium]|jgi:glucosamine-6-phosphate deaminase